MPPSSSDSPSAEAMAARIESTEKMMSVSSTPITVPQKPLPNRDFRSPPSSSPWSRCEIGDVEEVDPAEGLDDPVVQQDSEANTTAISRKTKAPMTP